MEDELAELGAKTTVTKGNLTLLAAAGLAFKFSPAPWPTIRPIGDQKPYRCLAINQ